MAATGTILTRVFTSQAQIPVAGATVAFTQRSTEGRHALLALRVTDANGRTQPVRVGTPDPSASESPGTITPFAVCDIWVESPGYELLVVENVQIFPNTETLQELELIPLPEQSATLLPENPVNVPPQNL
ncbi:spore cortex-lytic protein [Flavonifractor sp. AGMB03687]|uniref:spore cortex-lytic protein n=1 Tax=Flavonifractor sp. AGMB03687 TaxID=2785133 RepID=UPI001ADFF3E9|nr:spore cortex-lytic protein [Flavonifractor sp. AGMB03687]